jgi:hypothetical protein
LHIAQFGVERVAKLLHESEEGKGGVKQQLYTIKPRPD